MTFILEHPNSGWWLIASYDSKDGFLHIEPRDTVEQYVQYYNENNERPMTLEQIYIARTAYDYAKEWCIEHSDSFPSSDEALAFLKGIAKTVTVEIEE